MAQVIIKTGRLASQQHIYSLSNEKIQYLLKFVDSIADETDLMKEIETGLKQARQITKGEIARKSLKQMMNGK